MQGLKTLPLSFTNPRSVYWSHERDSYLVSHANIIEEFSETWVSRGQFSPLQISSSPISPAIVEAKGALIIAGNLSPEAWKLDKKTGEVLINRKYNFNVITQPKPYGDGLFMARTSENEKYGGPFDLTVFDEELSVVQQYRIPDLKKGQPYSHFAHNNLIGIVPGEHEGIRILFIEKETGQLVKVKKLPHCCKLSYNTTINDEYLYIAAADGIFCLDSTYSICAMKVLPFYLNYHIEVVHKQDQSEYFLTGHHQDIVTWQHTEKY